MFKVRQLMTQTPSKKPDKFHQDPSPVMSLATMGLSVFFGFNAASEMITGDILQAAAFTGIAGAFYYTSQSYRQNLRSEFQRAQSACATLAATATAIFTYNNYKMDQTLDFTMIGVTALGLYLSYNSENKAKALEKEMAGQRKIISPPDNKGPH
jgi:hypothetical protein